MHVAIITMRLAWSATRNTGRAAGKRPASATRPVRGPGGEGRGPAALSHDPGGTPGHCPANLAGTLCNPGRIHARHTRTATPHRLHAFAGPLPDSPRPGSWREGLTHGHRASQGAGDGHPQSAAHGGTRGRTGSRQVLRQAPGAAAAQGQGRAAPAGRRADVVAAGHHQPRGRVAARRLARHHGRHLRHHRLRHRPGRPPPAPAAAVAGICGPGAQPEREGRDGGTIRCRCPA